MTLVSQKDDNAINTPVPVAAPLTTEQRLRAGAYSLLASLLVQAPQQDLLDHLGMHSAADSASDDTAEALQALADAAIMAKPADLKDEFHELFIGLGRGELVPFGSWYITGYLMERPLSDLRDDLRKLGFARQDEVSESEDHVSALSEVMSIMITDGVAHNTQQQFFEQHMGQWLVRFYNDLRNANASTAFYRAVGQFGVAFTELEKQYFSMKV